ncbi:MAG: MoaD/ThiS family protein [Parvularculaceae bacterium]|nr:MoaD/ThiS family protein [Parvularculaceae bacterium]
MARVIFYGRLADRAGRERRAPVAGQGETLRHFLTRMAGDDAELAAMLSGQGINFAVNDSIAPPETVIGDADEIAVMPPFSGG